jgi:hypothetical protein
MTFDLKSFATNYFAANPSTNLYLLVDHAGMPGLNGKLGSGLVEWANLFAGSRESGAFSVAPILIFLGSSSALNLSNMFMRWLSVNGALTSSLIILASPEPIHVVKERLIARLDVKLSEGMESMLRFYDPRILEQLSKILSPRQAQGFFSPGTKWWYLNRGGKLGEIASEFTFRDEPDFLLSFNQNQEAVLLDSLEPDRILYLLRETVPQLESRLPPDQYEFIAEKLHAARDFGITSTADLTLYCTTALLYGNDFETQPYWSEALAEVRMQRSTFAQVVANSPEIEL